VDWKLSKMLTKAADRIAGRATSSAEKGTEDPTGPTQEGADYADGQFRDNKEEGKAFNNEAQRQAEKRGLRDPLQLERPFIDWLNKMFDAAAKLRERIAKWFKPGKVALVGSAVVVAMTASRMYLAVPNPDPPRPEPGPVETGVNSVNGIEIPEPLPNLPPVPDNLAMTDQDLLRAFDTLGIPTLAQMGREHVDLDVSDLPLPPVIAAASAAPVVAEVQQGGTTYSTTTTVEEAYRALPDDARAGFEADVRESTFDDHSIDLKDSFTVSSPIGSLTFSSS